jgi:hypothetical protein
MIRTYTPDALLQFKDSYAVTSDAAAQVSSADKIVDLGLARFEGVMVFNVSAIDIASGNETYDCLIQVSNSATFATASDIKTVATLRLEAATLGAAGRYEIPFLNVRDGTAYRYARIYTDVGGTTPSITYTAYAHELKWK